jgi:DNA polymerase-3 subunit gamma/tau
VSGTLLIFNEILNKGFDGHHFINGLSDHLRNLLVCKDRATVQLLEVAGEVKDRYELQAASSDNDFLLNALEISNNCDMQYKNTQNKRLLIELALMKMAQLTKKKT